jgi:hypothetical protein
MKKAKDQILGFLFFIEVHASLQSGSNRRFASGKTRPEPAVRSPSGRAKTKGER